MAVKYIFRYLKGMAYYTLNLGSGGKDLSGSDAIISGMCDADWAGDLDDRCSMTGYFFHFGRGGNVISWQTCKQSSVAMSSIQAKYQALSVATKETIWL